MLHTCAGIVLAAGASSRMGTSKALLKRADGRFLGEFQCNQLQQAGCEPVLLVLGSEADQIQKELPLQQCIVNENWTSGRISSVKAGVNAVQSMPGCILLPVDTAGINQQTLLTLRNEAQQTDAVSLRPFHQGERGNICWLSHRLFSEVMQLDPKARLDHLLMPIETHLDVNDPGVLNNVNTPDEWEKNKKK